MTDSVPLVLNIKFNGKPVTVDCLGADATVGDLKTALFQMTQVVPETQKILGLRTCNGEPIVDSLPLSKTIIKPNTKLMLIGSTQEAILNVAKIAESSSDIIDDFEFKEEDVNLAFLPENMEKVQRRSKAYRARRVCEPRQDKRLLVLDIDYTIFDHLSPAESARQLARPHLYDFLQRVYVHYDIAVWSATSMTWILAKLGQLGIIPSNTSAILRRQTESLVTEPSVPVNQSAEPEPPFQISLLLDSSDMISVHFPSHGVKEVKPLAVIWNNHPQWGPHNTLMLDDIRRNFVMNPQSGLRIRPYRDAHANRSTDHELQSLARYLEMIAKYENDFTRLNHNRWERYVTKRKRIRNRRDHAPRTHLQTAVCSTVSISSSRVSHPDHVTMLSGDPNNTAAEGAKSTPELNSSETSPDSKLPEIPEP